MNTEHTSDLQSVIDWMGFATADTKYKALVSVSEQQGWTLAENVSGYTDTAALSAVEGQIFGIDAADIPALYWAYERYENLTGSMDAYFGEFTDQERIDHAAFFLGEREWSFDKAVGFMASVCGLPGPKCFGWVCKIVAAEIRGGIRG